MLSRLIIRSTMPLFLTTDVKMIPWILFLAVFNGVANAQTNILHNADFESGDFNGNWYAIGCHMERSNDAYHGQHSARISNRNQNWNGVAQNVNLHAGSRYKVTAYVKLLNTANNQAYQGVTMMLTCKDSSQKAVYKKIGETPNVQPGDWYEIGGVLHTSNGYHSCHIYVQTDAHSDYLVDMATMVLVPYDSNWKTQANQRIEQNRKSDINIRLTGSSVDTSSIDIELQQTKMEFAFGSAVSATKIVDSSHTAYQQTFYDNFEWGVLENALKWRMMEWTKGHINYDKPLNAIKAMRSHGIKVRCHCAFWDKDENTQDWVKALHGDALKSAVHTRIQGVTSHTRGMCEQWDVNNEMFHGGTYERLSGDPNITMDMFRQMHAADGHLKLFLNDYGVISYSDAAVAMKDTAVKYKKAGVPIGGIGVQGHMHAIDVHVIKAQLDILAETGLPIMITEFAVNDANENSRATKLADLLTLFFSHPAVKGVLMWGFWDGQIWEKDAPLFTGTNVTPNAAGRAYQNLFHNTWRTHVTHTIHGHEQYHVRGFNGEYTLKVKHNGKLLKTQTFTLSQGGKSLQIHLNGNTGKHFVHLKISWLDILNPGPDSYRSFVSHHHILRNVSELGSTQNTINLILTKQVKSPKVIFNEMILNSVEIREVQLIDCTIHLQFKNQNAESTGSCSELITGECQAECLSANKTDLVHTMTLKLSVFLTFYLDVLLEMSL